MRPRSTQTFKAFAVAAALTAGTAAMAEPRTYTTTDSFDDVVFSLENAIIGRGLVIDHTNYVGDMLERTREDVGSDVVLFSNAQVVSFCSATTSREVMEADPMNLVWCPYGIFVAQLPDSADEVTVGFHDYPEGPMDAVETLLDSIVREALMLD
ncbi:DUF302 domain-containing protein [Mesobacterium pallidum]|uniref:DUF302 domain-containing protein n=1 Tax=Mesobacterium pallidum TaxID=2872037 RepID=UPI001EE291D3|nr:DUF302 domain-containing protein [Mesobacterium pallidum]